MNINYNLDIISKFHDFIPVIEEDDDDSSLFEEPFNTVSKYNTSEIPIISKSFACKPLAFFQKTPPRLSTANTLEYQTSLKKANSSLWGAVERNDIEAILNLLDPHSPVLADPNAPGLDNWTSLHIASAYGFKEACEILLDDSRTVDVNARTSVMRTPLHLSVIHNHLEVVKVLVYEGALVNLSDSEMNTSLHYASTFGYAEIVEWLLRKNPNLHAKNSRGRTPADLAFNYETFAVFAEYCEKNKLSLPVTGYSRAVVHRTLLHNSREDKISKLLTKGQKGHNLNDFKVFAERSKPAKKEPKFDFKKLVLPPSKVGPNDFNGLLQLGKGSFGEVYLVEKKDTLERFALKVLVKEKVLGNNMVKYAFTERNILMTISHPFIVKLNYAFQTPEKLAMVMDYCPNGDLGTQLARDRKFSEEKARFYLAEVLLALEELHKHGIIFRDLKPENVVLDSQGHAKLTDFGLSKEGYAEDQLAKSFCGTVAYLAPEIIRRSGHTKAVDWYLFGALFYEMLVGFPPYYSTNREELFNNIQRGSLKIPPGVSSEAKNLIRRLMHRDPSKRLGSSKKDSEEVKLDPFFKNVNWGAILALSVKPPSFHPIKRIFKGISTAKMFGKLQEENNEARIEGWSVLRTV